MANYSIQRSDLATGNITVTEASTNTATNATLIGQNFTGYGDEIATNFLQMLENFATDVDPTTNPRVVGSAIRGQLWYDTTGTGTMKVYNGASFDEMAKINDGATESSVIRWNNASGRYQPEERIRVSDAGVLIIDNADTGANAVTFVHDATDLNIAGTGTTDINVTGVTAVNIPALTLTTVLDETFGGTGVITYATGDILTATGADVLEALTVGANGTVLTVVAGEPVWQATGAGVTTLTTLTDVDTSGVITGSLLYKTAGDWTDTPGLTWNVIAGNLSATRFGNILEGNLLDKAQNSEVISGTNWDFAGLSVSSGQLAATTGTTLRILSSDNTDWVDFSHDLVDFNIAATATTDINITGAGVKIDGNQLYIDNVTGESIRLQGNSSGNANQTYINFRKSDNTISGSIGVVSASNNAVRITGTEDGVEIVGTDSNIKFDTGAAGTTFRAYNDSNEESLLCSTVGVSLKTSRVRIYTDVGNYSAGFNETPQNNSGNGLNSGGTYNVDIDDIGLLLLRTTSSASTIAFGTMVTVPTGATVLVNNDASGTCTISSPGMTLNWVDGSGGAAPTGNRTLARNSIATLRKKSGSVWQIWGNGIS